MSNNTMSNNTITTCLLFLVIMLSVVPLHRAEERQDTIHITGSRITGTQSRPVIVITTTELSQAPIATLSEALALEPLMDIQSRGLPGAQADITMRGGMFEQVLILVDGVRMNSAQTGHLHADLPVALSMIERVEILPGQASSLYGGDAINGVINIITKKNIRGFSSSLHYGNYNTRNAMASLGFQSGFLNNSISVEHAQSDGYRYDTDYKNTFLNLKTRASYNQGLLDISFYMSEREFGAYDFYTPGKDYPSKEWTHSRGFIVRNRHSFKRTIFESFVSLREQYNHFVLFVDNPQLYENKHTTRYLEAETYAIHTLTKKTILVGGCNASLNHITSSNLKDHQQQQQAVFSEIRQTLSPALQFTGGWRLDRIRTDIVSSPTLHINYQPLNRLSLFLQAGIATRTPSYTELFYADPVNQGNPHLKNEHAHSVEIGAQVDWKHGIQSSFRAHNTIYANYIDWVDTNDTGSWYAQNITSLHVFGFEPKIHIDHSLFSASLALSLIKRYKQEAYISKYAFRFPHTALVFTGTIPLGNHVTVTLNNSYRQRTDETGYMLSNVRSTIKVGYGMTLFIDVKNVTDKKYEDVPGVPQPGRMILGGIIFKK